MPPKGYHTITISDEVHERVTAVMDEYDCRSLAEAVDTATKIALERDSSELARILAKRLNE